MSLRDKIRARTAQKNGDGKGKDFIKSSSLKMKWQDGANPVRLVGGYTEVHVHNLSPSNFGSIGVADGAFFKGKGALPFEVVCTDWNLKEEKYHKESTCPFCKLYRRAKEALKNKDLEEEDRKMFENIANACKPQTVIKWNLIDRKNPFYLKGMKDKEEKVPGYKYANMSFTMFKDVAGVIDQLELDISDPNEGVDIIISKDGNSTPTKYTVQAQLVKGSVKVTPLTEEEASWKLWDFVEMYDKSYDFGAIKEKMHEEFIQILSLNDEEFKSFLEGGIEGEADDSKKN